MSEINCPSALRCTDYPEKCPGCIFNLAVKRSLYRPIDPGKDGIHINTGNLQHCLKKLGWKDVLEYLKERYSPTSVTGWLQIMTPQQQQEFEREVMSRIEKMPVRKGGK